jgi:hypothetical protein
MQCISYLLTLQTLLYTWSVIKLCKDQAAS